MNLEKGKADIAFRATNGTLMGDSLISHRLPDIKWGVYCSDAYVGANGKPSTMDDIKEHAIVAYNGLVATMHFSIWFMSFVRGEQVATACNSVPNMAGSLRAGMGVGPLPAMVGMMTPGLDLCFPPPVETDSTCWIVAPPDAYRQPRVRSFLAFAAEQIRHDKSGWLRNQGLAERAPKSS